MAKGDSQEDIQMCLNCPKPKCNNCLGKYESGSGASTRKLIKLQELAKQGMTDAQMGEILDIHPNTVYILRKRLGIPNYRDRKYGRKEMTSA